MALQKKKGRPSIKDKTTKPSPVLKSKSEFTVEKGVAITGNRSFNCLDEFPFSAMSVGDSFLIPKNHRHALKPNTLHYAAKQFAKMQPGFSVTTRVQVNKDRRVWRIK